jgi:hypothetical protein
MGPTLSIGVIILNPVRQLRLTLPLNNLRGPHVSGEFQQVLKAEQLPWVLQTFTS